VTGVAAHRPESVADGAEEGLAYDPGNLNLLGAMRSVGHRVF
jgi:hypothetical protein